MIADYSKIEKLNGIKLPKFKGKVKITLHNPTTGKNEIVEGENIVTNAVRDIMLANYMGGIDYSKMFPLWSKWFSGILCYQNPHSAVGGVIDPDNYYCYTEDQNPLTAHAGNTIIDADHDDNTKRGNPSTLSYVYNENSVKQVFEWTPSHGNGTISSLSLVNGETGNAGLGSDTHYFKNLFNPMENIAWFGNQTVENNSPENIVAIYDDSHGLMFYTGDTGNFRGKLSTNKITVLVKKLAVKSSGLYQNIFPSIDYQRMFTVDTSVTFKIQPAYYFDKETKYLWLFTNINGYDGYQISYNKTTVNYTVIDCENEEEVTHGQIISDTDTLAPVCFEAYNDFATTASNPRYPNIIKDGDYVYLPTGTAAQYNPNASITGYKKINITSQADQEAITFNEALSNHRPVMKSGNFLIASSRVVNNGIGYTCQESTNMYRSLATPYNVSSYSMQVGRANAANAPRQILVSRFLNTTKYNLPSSVTKTSAQSMIIEYTLQEVDGGSES